MFKMASLVLLSLLGLGLGLGLASNSSYFELPEISYSTPSGRPGQANLNQVYFNVTDAQNGGNADCYHSWPLEGSAPNITDPAICNDTQFTWHFGPDSVVDNFDVVVKHRLHHHHSVKGTSPRYVVGGPGAEYECGGSGACSFWVEGPLKVYFN